MITAKKAIFWGALLLAFFIPAAGYMHPRIDEPAIRVGLWSNQQNLMISANSQFDIVSGVTHSRIGQFKAGEKVLLTAKEGRIAVNGMTQSAESVSVVPHDPEGLQYIEVNKRKYRGALEIHKTFDKTGLTAVNTLPLEQYLYGVIAREISPDWPLESLKAQAVAARTYALKNMNKHKNDGYDVCATTDCQVYGGLSSEAPAAVKAVNETRGQVLTYKGQLIAAYFHSSSGGFTESSEAVWGNYLPYLRGVNDKDPSPYASWEKQLPLKEVETLLAGAGYNGGALQAIVLSPLSPPPVHADDRGISGRVTSIRFIGEHGSIQLTGNKVRTLLGLNSTLFDISMIIPQPKVLKWKITDSAGDHMNKEVAVNLPPGQDQTILLDDKKNIRRISGYPNETMVIKGMGWGHGVGMSQWGAKAMAEKAPQGDTTYFIEILKHYYQDVEIEKFY
jgi:stage II sporulation protein D